MKTSSCLLAVLFCLIGFAIPVYAEDQQPNVVLIFADDLGYGDLGCYGATKIKTPNIDQLAKEGRRFTDAHSSSAVCSPSRYGLMTGNYPLRANFWGPTSFRQGLTIGEDQQTIASVLKEAGYVTACIGKWHLGFGKESANWNGELKPGPLEVGFDYYYGMPTVNSGPPFVFVENHRVVGFDPKDPFIYGKKSVTKVYPEKGGYTAIGGAKKAHETYVDDQVGTVLKNKAIEWLAERKKDKPFFLFLATTNIHHPFTPAKQFVGTSDCGLYGDFVHELDWMVGEVMGQLDKMGVSENTLFIFTSDNGGMLHKTGQAAWKAGHRLNGDLLGFKFGAWEGGHRVPFVARWPKKIPAGTESDQLLSHIDLIATLTEVTKGELKEGQGKDSLNQLETLTGEPEEPIRRTMVVTPNSPKHLSIRHGKWVYIPQKGAGGFQGKKVGDHLFSDAAALPFTGMSNSDVEGGKIKADAPLGQLYDLDSDPQQTINLYSKNPEVVKELQAMLDGYRKEIPKGKPMGWINLKQ